MPWQFHSQISTQEKNKIFYTKAFTQMFIATILLIKKNVNSPSDKQIKCKMLLNNERKFTTTHNIECQQHYTNQKKENAKIT